MLRSGKSLKISTSSNVQQDESSTPNGTSLVALLNLEEEEEDSRLRKKISVLAKVKQRARKWRLTLNKKRNPPSGNSNSEHSWQKSYRDNDDGHHEQEDDAEIFRTPRYEFEREVEEKKRASCRQHFGTTCTMRNVFCNSKEYSDHIKEGTSIPNFLDKTSTEAIASEIESLGDYVVPASVDLNMSAGAREEDDGSSESAEQWAAASPKEMKWDKGVSVKEYLVDKLRPGEEDKALCRAITDAINPSIEGSLLDMLRNTVTSLLLRKESYDLGEDIDDRKTS